MNSIPRFTCVDCGQPVSAPHVKRCRSCYFKHSNQNAKTTPLDKRICSKCGLPLKGRYATLCQDCYRERLSEPKEKKQYPPCPKCGGKKFRRATLCKQCWEATHGGKPKCAGCGKELARYKPQKGNGGDYCQDCYKGERTIRWNPELTDDERYNQRRGVPGYGDWRTAIYTRDNFTCQKCNDNSGGNLVAHHLYSYKTHPDLRTVVDNGITLCEDCHRTFHRLYGATNNTPEQIQDFLQRDN